MDVLQWYPCLCVDDIERAIAFYRALLDLPVSADAGWYVELGEQRVTVSFVERHHPSVPASYGHERGGVLVSVIVDDADTAWSRAQAMSAPVAVPCRDEEFGQRHFMVFDPDGFVVDVIQRIPPSLEFRRALVAGRRRQRG
jgi:uncharacterized glyoxalase superfamily protein PhnB